MEAGNAAGMLSTHPRRVNELLALATNREQRFETPMDMVSERAWSMGELNGLLPLLRNFEGTAKSLSKAE